MAEPSKVNRFDRERAIFDGGHWARLTLLERGVLGVFLVRSDFHSGEVIISMTLLAEKAGIKNLQRAREACHSLEAIGLVRTIEDGGGAGKATVREVLCPRPLPGTPGFDLFSGTETGTVTGPVYDGQNRAGQRTKTGPVSDKNRAGERSKTGPVSGPPSDSHITIKSPHPPKTGTPSGPVSSTTQPSGGGGQEEEEYLKELGKRGIWKSSAATVARHIARADADAIWREVVNDKQVQPQNRGKVYFRRLQKLYKNEL